MIITLLINTTPSLDTRFIKWRHPPDPKQMVTTGNTIENLAEGASLLQRMQDLEVQVETPHVKTVVKKHDREGTSKEHKNEDKDFEGFKQYKAMKKRCE